MGGNLNVVLVKLADRVHNMRTLGAMPAEKRAKKAKETMELFVPLAKTVGVAPIEAELRRLSAQHLSPLAELSAAATASELQASRPNSWPSLVRGFVDESFAKAPCPALVAVFLLEDRALREADLGGKLVAHRQAWAAHCAAADARTSAAAGAAAAAAAAAPPLPPLPPRPPPLPPPRRGNGSSRGASRPPALPVAASSASAPAARRRRAKRPQTYGRPTRRPSWRASPTPPPPSATRPSTRSPRSSHSKERRWHVNQSVNRPSFLPNEKNVERKERKSVKRNNECHGCRMQ